MSMGDNGIDLFLQTWAAEFSVSLTNLLSQTPSIECTRARHLGAVDLQGVLWWRATIIGTQAFCIWVGARETTWAVAGKLNWLRLLERTQAAAVASVNRDLIAPVQSLDAQIVYEAPDVQTLCYALLGIRLTRTELPALLFALEPAARLEFQLRNPSGIPAPMLDRLLNLELPLSVALGRAKLPIGEVLKITSGSVVQLNGYNGSQVEVIVHGTVVATGQVVSNKGSYGVRITNIISQLDRATLYQRE